MAKQSAASALGTPINQIIVSIAVGVILWVAIRQSAGGQYGAGDFITYMAALLHLLNQLKTLSNVQRGDPARAHRGRERLRADRRDARTRCRHRRRSGMRAAASASST